MSGWGGPHSQGQFFREGQRHEPSAASLSAGGRTSSLVKGTGWAGAISVHYNSFWGQEGGVEGGRREAALGLTSGTPFPDTVLSEGQRHPSCVGERRHGQ